MADSFLFIPDISGFTEFVNHTEISHSQHIISELLELLADADELKLTLSEVEGDALLFYLKDEVPDLKRVVRQAKNMFIKFHAHLKRYEKERICQCGACTSAAGLSLKMVAHRGEIGFIKVKEFEKAHGGNLVLVHRLLKNQIPSSDYLLFSEQMVNGVNDNELAQLTSWAEWRILEENFEGLGKINYRWLPLQPLYKEVPEPPPLKALRKTGNPVVVEEFIPVPPSELYEVVSNLDQRLNWNTEITELNYEKDRVNRVGETHLCLLEQGTFEFETVTTDFGPGTQVYGERTTQIPLINEATTYWIISPGNEGSKLRIEAHLRPFPVLGHLILPMLRKQLDHSLKKSVKRIKQLLLKKEIIPAAVSV